MEEQFVRTIQLIGEAAFARLQSARVVLLGVGGVGGWCAETLVRSGVQHLTLIDMDQVSTSNLNRQLVATTENIGRSKVVEMRARLLSIHPEADITAIHARYTAEGKLAYSAASENMPVGADTCPLPFDFSAFDYVVDAIDSIDSKIRLIHEVTGTTREDGSYPKLFSSMGAGRKMDTEQIRVSEFWKVEGCPLARALRQKMKKSGCLPQRKFPCVWSPELSGETGTLAPIVGVFGMKLASLVLREVMEK